MKLHRNIIIVAIVIVLLGIAMYFVSKVQPEAPQEAPAEASQSAEPENLIYIDQTNPDLIQKITVKNDEGEYFLHKGANGWSLNGDETIRLKQTAVASLVYSFSSISVKEVIAESSEHAADFGFAAPTGYAVVSLSDGTEKTVTIGNKSLDGQDYYIMISGDDKIYLKNSFGSESMIPSEQSLRELAFLTIDSENLMTMEHFSMSRKGSTAVKLESANQGTNEEPNIQWKMILPVPAEVNGQNLSTRIMKCFENFSADAVVEDHAKSLHPYGLNTPYAEFKVVGQNQSLHMKIGNETDTCRFAMVEGSDTVYLIQKTKLTFLDVSYVDLMSNLIHVEYIKDVNKVEAVLGERTYQMEITGETGSQEYFIDGVKIEKSAFSKAYQAVIGISLDSLDLDPEPNIATDGYVRYTKKDGSIVTVEFLPVDDRNYRVVVDGKGNSITGKKNVEAAFDKIEETKNNAQS